MEIMREYLATGLVWLLGLGMVYVTAYVVRYAAGGLRARMGADKFDQYAKALTTLKEYTATTVRALEQMGILRQWTGEQKKAMAKVAIHKFLIRVRSQNGRRDRR